MRLTKPQQLIYEMDRFAGGAISVVCGSMIMQGSVEATALTKAANDIFRLNEALRIRIQEVNGEPQQFATEYEEKEIEVLRFDTKEELDAYASKYAKELMDIYGELCTLKAVILKDGYGMIAKTHHIVSDAWTLTMIGTQLSSLLRGEMPEVYGYSDYLVSENAYLQSTRHKKDREFFLEQYKRCNEITYLSDKQTSSLESCRKTYIIDRDDTSRINAYAKQKNVSAFVLFMTALAIYYNRVKMNTEQFYIGTAVLNRVNHKEKHTMGMYINTAPVLIELGNEESFEENLKKVTKCSMSVLRHQKYNYGDTLKELRKEYDFSQKLYDVMLSYQNAKLISSEGFESTWYACGQQNESLQIHIDDHDSEGIFRIHYDYQIEKYTETDMEMLHRHIMTILQDAMTYEDKKLYELEILLQEEKQKLLYEFNDTAVDYPKDKCVHELFEEQVAKTPDKVAVIACDQTLTYRQLNEQANRIAHGLVEKGVQVGDIVAFALSRKSYLIATMLGILKAGAAYLPIDPDYPQDRIDFMLEDSGAKFVVTDDNVKEYSANSNVDNLEVEVLSGSLCYCIYTSGSTGKPKGTLLTHANVVNYVNNNKSNVINIIIKNQYQRIVSVTTVGFDIFVTESILMLTNGKEILLANEEQAKIQFKLNELLEKYPAEVLQTTPTKMKSLIADSEHLDYLKNIEVLIIGGELLDEVLIEQLQAITKADIHNIYGPTEATVWATSSTVSKVSDITIGKPIANTQIYILDNHLQPVPIGVTGELCIAGDGVGAGYLNRPELTAEKFVDNPFGEGKMYRTGDLAYWREDGNIVYVGRNDFQVKIRGLRIELGEIENAISCVDGVTQAVVIVRKNEEGRQFICAFYTGEKVDAKKLRAQIGQKLPQYMIPHVCLHLDEMPLTTSGKVNRKALPAIDLQHMENTVEYVEPQTEQEKILTAAIGQVLGNEKIGIQDNFFDLGGDSLKAIQLISKLEQAGYQTNTKTIFACNTVQQLAEKLIVSDRQEKQSEYKGNIRATAAQMRIYTAQSMDVDSTTYNVPYMFKTKKICIKQLEKAVRQLINRHETLRTHFDNVEGKIIQVVNDSVEFEVEKIRDGKVENFIRPFDLSKAPLFRVGVFKDIVMIDMHHIITDGSSMPIFLQELNELYMERELCEKPMQYGQFALEIPDYTESEKYWLSVYQDELPVLEINTDYKRGTRQSFQGDSLYASINIGLHNEIVEKCKELNITPYVFYMGGFNIFLSKISGNEDIVVGMPISGRNSRYLHTIGMFVNTIALRNKVNTEESINAFLQKVKDNSIEAITYQDYPYGELIKKLNINTRERNPLFDVMFAYQSEEMTEVIFGDEPAEILPVPIRNSKYDFTFNVMPREQDVVLMIEYCTDLYKKTTMQRYVEGYIHLLEEMLTCSKALKDISCISKQELDTLLKEFNNTCVDYPKDKCVHELFEEQVAKTPDKVAVIACDQTLTYRQLNEQANRIAHGLVEKGVQVGDIVAFALSRKSYLVATMFGILKAGAAYLPIDPDYPQDRIDFMLEDSGAKVIITDNGIQEYLTYESLDNLNRIITCDALCYCIYTSGTTGVPKGVAITHRNVINFCYNCRKDHFQNVLINNCESVLSTNYTVFDIVLQEIFLPLLNGIKVIFANESAINNIENVVSQLVEDKIGFITTPTKLSMYLNNEEFCHALNKFSLIMIGAEKLPEALVNHVKQYTDAVIFNGYGPTETTCGVSYAKIDSSDITIGKPIANTQIYILDNHLQPVPIGVTGELCIAGDGVGAGYLNRPELTAEKFVENPFGEGKMYRTGDLAYWREDGNIVYVGRNDFQVKIRGLRIELGEIESVLSSVEGITQSVVIVRKNREGRQFICAFYTGKETDPKELRKRIGQKLPKYMLPHILTHIEAIPLTTSGKVNRKTLPEVSLETITSDVEYLPPKTQQQKVLCQLVEEVLGVSPIGIQEDFFDMGGDSLKAIEYVSKAHNEGIYFSMQNVFDYPTVELLTNYMEQGDKKTISYDEVDFASIDTVLAKNQWDDRLNRDKIAMYENRQYKNKCSGGAGENILLAGATGYLGIHILANFLEKDTGMAFCLIRGTDTDQSIKRLKELLNYYFEDKYTACIDDRIKVYCADLQKENLGLSKEDYEYLVSMTDTVINAAASVKHYGSYKYFKEANVDTVEKLITFCEKSDAKLIHTSTLSVSGNSFGDDFDGYISEEEKHFKESNLYIGQPLENVYARSKFEAEKLILDAMTKGLKANIMRMGNLTNRMDGKFQVNYESNAFLQRVKAILDLGVFPEYLMYLYTEFTPIDDAATAVMTITRHFSTEYTVFHINSIKVVYFDKLMEYFHRLGFGIQTVDGTTFTEALRRTTKNTGMEYIFETFINDMDENDRLNYDSNIRIDNDFTVKYLRNLGFEWSEIDFEYVRRYVEYFKEIGYFINN